MLQDVVENVEIRFEILSELQIEISPSINHCFQPEAEETCVYYTAS